MSPQDINTANKIRLYASRGFDIEHINLLNSENQKDLSWEPEVAFRWWYFANLNLALTKRSLGVLENLSASNS